MAEKILVIDDDEELAALIGETLKLNGYEVIYAYNARNGLEMVSTEKPDMVVLDIGLPGGMDGLEVCELIKKDKATKGIPVLMLTANDSDDSVQKALENDADWYMTKPFNTRYLMKTVNKLIDRRKKELQNG